jgi:hypothetical protein
MVAGLRAETITIRTKDTKTSTTMRDRLVQFKISMARVGLINTKTNLLLARMIIETTT